MFRKNAGYAGFKLFETKTSLFETKTSRQRLTMGKKLIPDEIREKVSIAVEKFNQQELKGMDARYIARFQGRILYLDRVANGQKEPVCCMEYIKEIDKWEFALFKWSTEIYDPDEFMFSGSEFVDGTVEGAMRAGMRAYPV